MPFDFPPEVWAADAVLKGYKVAAPISLDLAVALYDEGLLVELGLEPAPKTEDE